MPFDLMFGKVLEGALTDNWKEILLGMLEWQAEGAVFGSIEPIIPGFSREGGRELFKGRLVWFFEFEEFGHVAPSNINILQVDSKYSESIPLISYFVLLTTPTLKSIIRSANRFPSISTTLVSIFLT